MWAAVIRAGVDPGGDWRDVVVAPLRGGEDVESPGTPGHAGLARDLEHLDGIAGIDAGARVHGDGALLVQIVGLAFRKADGPDLEAAVGVGVNTDGGAAEPGLDKRPRIGENQLLRPISVSVLTPTGRMKSVPQRDWEPDSGKTVIMLASW